MNPKLWIFGMLVLVIGICGVYAGTVYITSPGTYDVGGSTIKAGDYVYIQTDDVVINGKNSYLRAIYIQGSNFDNITINDLSIKSGSKKDGFNIGGSNNKIKLNSVSIWGDYYGIYISGSGNEVYGNIKEITSYRKDGIYISGSDNKIKNISGSISGLHNGITIYGNKNEILGDIKGVTGKSNNKLDDAGIYINGDDNLIKEINGDVYSDNRGIWIIGSRNEIYGKITYLGQILGASGGFGYNSGVYIDGNNNIIKDVDGQIRASNYGIYIKGEYNEIGSNGDIYGGYHGIYIFGSNNKVLGNIKSIKNKDDGGKDDASGIYINGQNNLIQKINGNIWADDYGIYIKGGDGNHILGKIGTIYGEDHNGIYIEGNNLKDTIIENVSKICTNDHDFNPYSYDNRDFGIYIVGNDNTPKINDSDGVIEVTGLGISGSRNKILFGITEPDTNYGYAGVYISGDDNLVNDIRSIYGYYYGVKTEGSRNKILGNIRGVTGEHRDGIYISGYDNLIENMSGNIYGHHYGIYIINGDGNHILGRIGIITGKYKDGI
ncbi:MAG: hypothetical protein ABGW92_03085, partial [Methanocaldococcus sp.]